MERPAYNNPAGTTIMISGNIIKDNSRVADAYGIFINALQNFTISNNTITPVQGLGIMIDSWNAGISQNGSIYGNDVNVIAGGNLEYPYSTTVIALRLRNNCDADNLSAHRNIRICNNTFLARANGNGAWAAVGLRITEQNYNSFGDNSNLLIDHNTFQAITYVKADRASFAITLDSIDSGTGNDVLSSNDTSLALETWTPGKKRRQASFFPMILSLTQGAAWFCPMWRSTPDTATTPTRTFRSSTRFTNPAASGYGNMGRPRISRPARS
jgi:hypothetical protein